MHLERERAVSAGWEPGCRVRGGCPAPRSPAQQDPPLGLGAPAEAAPLLLSVWRRQGAESETPEHRPHPLQHRPRRALTAHIL